MLAGKYISKVSIKLKNEVSLIKMMTDFEYLLLSLI